MLQAMTDRYCRLQTPGKGPMKKAPLVIRSRNADERTGSEVPVIAVALQR